MPPLTFFSHSQRQTMPAAPESLPLVTCQLIGQNSLPSSSRPLYPGRSMLLDAPHRATPTP